MLVIFPRPYPGFNVYIHMVNFRPYIEIITGSPNNIQYFSSILKTSTIIINENKHTMLIKKKSP